MPTPRPRRAPWTTEQRSDVMDAARDVMDAVRDVIPVACEALLSKMSLLLWLRSIPCFNATATTREALYLCRPCDELFQHGRSRKAAHECLYGLVKRPETQDGPGEPQNAQLGDQQAPRRRVEDPDGIRQAALHRRGQEAEGPAHEGPSGLQVPSEEETEEHYEEGPVRVPVSVLADYASRSSIWTPPNFTLR
ncbi:hypothetical protein GQR58_021780 [Nymphon striatum]|nr:hypothetical protein GQR58_021780 [Nymphon striatum]